MTDIQSPFTEEQKRVIQSIRNLEIRLRKKVNQVFTGEHHSAFKGQGMEFNEVRKYVRGDDVKNIEWNVTARTNNLHVKVFQEERELIFNILFDISASQNFGSQSKSKREVATEIAASLAFASIKNRDKIGFLSFSDIAEHYLPPRRGSGHVFKIIKESFLVHPHNQKSNLKNALQFFNRMQKKSSVIFIISDFFFVDDYKDLLRQLVQKHSIIVFHIQDRLELNLPKLGLIALDDLEDQESYIINTYSKKFQKDYFDMIEERNENLKKDFQKMKIKYLIIDTGKDYLQDLSHFFRQEVIR